MIAARIKKTYMAIRERDRPDAPVHAYLLRLLAYAKSARVATTGASGTIAAADASFDIVAIEQMIHEELRRHLARNVGISLRDRHHGIA